MTGSIFTLLGTHHYINESITTDTIKIVFKTGGDYQTNQRRVQSNSVEREF